MHPYKQVRKPKQNARHSLRRAIYAKNFYKFLKNSTVDPLYMLSFSSMAYYIPQIVQSSSLAPRSPKASNKESTSIWNGIL